MHDPLLVLRCCCPASTKGVMRTHTAAFLLCRQLCCEAVVIWKAFQPIMSLALLPMKTFSQFLS